MKGPGSVYVVPSIVTWFSCMHSRSADCVFGEARLISSTSSRFAKTGPGRNSNSFVRWSYTLTPVTSDGRRSGVNCRRENSRSSERASALASIVFPTPGKSSMIRCPSATRQSTQRRSVSCGACTTLPRFSVTRSSVSARGSRAVASLRASMLLPALRCVLSLLEQPLDLVEHGGGDRLLRRLRHFAFPSLGQQDNLVVGRVEADPVAPYVVVDDEIHLLVVQHRALSLEPGRADLGAEAHEHLAVPVALAELAQDVYGRLELQGPPLAAFRALARRCLGRPVVGDGGGHDDDVGGVRARGHLAVERG